MRILERETRAAMESCARSFAGWREAARASAAARGEEERRGRLIARAEELIRSFREDRERSRRAEATGGERRERRPGDKENGGEDRGRVADTFKAAFTEATTAILRRRQGANGAS